MLYQQSRSAYQDAVANETTLSGLMQLLYTNLARDLLSAARAIRANNIEGRCAASNHALTLLGHLESWIQEFAEPELGNSLQGFYQILRATILKQQVGLNAGVFEEYAQMVLDIRASWQAKEQSAFSSTCSSTGSQEPGGISLQA